MNKPYSAACDNNRDPILSVIAPLLKNAEALFCGVGDLLQKGGLFLLYGPFNFKHRYTSDSNKRFDGMLRARDPGSGIRDFEDLDRLAADWGMIFREVYSMPANNYILNWVKR